MTDLLKVLPSFPLPPSFANLLPALERHGVTTTDLVTLDAAELGRRTRLPLLDLKRLAAAVLRELHRDLGVVEEDDDEAPKQRGGAGGQGMAKGQSEGRKGVGGSEDEKVGGQAGEGGKRPANAAADLGSDVSAPAVVIADKSTNPAEAGKSPASIGSRSPPPAAPDVASLLSHPRHPLPARARLISTLSPALDAALGGGIPAGYVTEVVGEAGAGKTQFLLALLLAVQLPPPRGLGRPALYVSTEAPLSTRRLSQMLAANAVLREARERGREREAEKRARRELRRRREEEKGTGNGEREDEEEEEEEEEEEIYYPTGGVPSLDGILSTVTPDLESQDHILQFQVPVEVERRGIGLLVVDSVAANYRAEFERSKEPASNGGGGGGGAASSSSNAADNKGGRAATGTANNAATPTDGGAPDAAAAAAADSRRAGASNMGARGAELVRLGRLLRELARRHDMAVVVANQVADRFTGTKGGPAGLGAAGGMHVTTSSSMPHHHQPSAHDGAGDGGGTEPPRSSAAPATQQQRDGDSTHHHNHHPALQLDHQQRWFTGWGDDPLLPEALLPPKTPSLGLVWSTQIAGRIALLKRGVLRRQQQKKSGGGGGGGALLLQNGADGDDYDDYDAAATSTTWKRWMKVVFAPHVAPSGQGLQGATEFEITMGGVNGLVREEGKGGGGSRKRKAGQD